MFRKQSVNGKYRSTPLVTFLKFYSRLHRDHKIACWERAVAHAAKFIQRMRESGAMPALGFEGSPAPACASPIRENHRLRGRRPQLGGTLQKTTVGALHLKPVAGNATE